MKSSLVHATLVGATILLAGCGADTKPLWYTNTNVFSAPMLDQNGNVRVLQTYAQMKSVLISPTGDILDQQPVAGTNPDYHTVHSDTDTNRNLYSYGITSSLEVRKWDATGNLLFHKSIALPLGDDVTASSAHYFDAGDGRQLMQLMLSSGYPDYSPSQMLVLIDENGEKIAELAVDADVRVIAASSQRALVHASNGGAFIRLPQRADVLMSPVGLRHAQGKLWLLTSSFSNGSGSETFQSLSQLWSFDSDSGQSQRHFSTFKQLLDYTVANDSSIYVSHVGYVDGITPSGVARYE